MLMRTQNAFCHEYASCQKEHLNKAKLAQTPNAFVDYRQIMTAAEYAPFPKTST